MTDNELIGAEAERQRVDALSEWYLTTQLDFDKRLIQFRYQTLRPHIRGQRGLEYGPAEGQMTRFLLSHFQQLTVVDGAAQLLAKLPDVPTLIKVHALFEEYVPETTFDTIIMEHILEHIERPVELLRRATTWLAPEGVLLLGVPNGHSIHRLAAVKMGLLQHACELNKRDHELGHRRVYTPSTFRTTIEQAGLRIVQMGGVFLKPISNQQIEDQWTEEMIQGFYELGKDFPDIAAEIYAICQPER